MRSLPYLLALFCCSSLSAQVPLPPGARTFAPHEKMIPWPAELGTGPVRDVVGAFWHTNNTLSAVGLRGTAAGIAVAPAITSAVRPLDLTTIAADAVTLPLAEGPGSTQHDVLLFSGLPGVDLGLAWSGPTGDPVVSLVTQSGWSRATKLTVRRDGTGFDVIGKAFSGSTLLRTRYEQGVFVPVPDVAIGATIRDLCFIDYDQDANGDAAVLTDTELRIVDVAGTTLFSLALAAPGGAIAPVPQFTLRNSLALLRRTLAPAGWELVHISQAAVEPPQAVTLLVADFVVGGMGSGDFDGDAIYDLAIQDGGNTVRLVRNQGAGPQPHFAGANLIEPVTIGSLGGVQAQASVRDYDHDGCADLLVPLAAAGSNWLVLSGGTRTRFNLAAETLPNIFGEFAHEIDPSDVLQLRLLTEHMTDFAKLSIFGYTAHEDDLQPPNPGYATERFAIEGMPMADLVAMQSEVWPPLAGEDIHYRNLLFVQVQLFDEAGLQRPSFFTGGTINHGGGPTPWSDYLTANAFDGADPQNITRKDDPGRKIIGFHVRQKVLPIR